MRCCQLEGPRRCPFLLPLSEQVQPPSEILEVSRSMLSDASHSKPPIHHLSTHPSIHSPHLSFIHCSIHPFVGGSTHLSFIHPPTHTSIHTSIHIHIYPYIYPAIHPSICPSTIHPPIHHSSIHASIIHLSIHSPIHVSSILHFFVQPDKWAPRRNAWVHRRRGALGGCVCSSGSLGLCSALVHLAIASGSGIGPGWEQCVGQAQLKWRAGRWGGLLSEGGRFGAGNIGWASPPSRGPGESPWAWALGAGTCEGKNTWGSFIWRWAHQ